MSNSESIPAQIQRFRTELDMSARQLSIALGRNEAYVWNIENEKMRPDFDALVEIAEFFAKRGKHLQLVPSHCVCSSPAA
jgi:transcriptional regulator with XRE-family HTH domain